MSTPTPQTDSAYLEHRHWANEDEATEAIEDFRDLARKLETELAEQQWLHGSAVKRAKELAEELARERGKVRVLRDACVEVERYAIEGSENERLLRSALAATEDAP